MGSKKYDVVVSGYLGVDLIPTFKKNKSYRNVNELFSPGKLTEIDGMHVTLGGVVANTGIALKRFDKNVVLNGLVGNDFMGAIIREKLAGMGIADGIKTTAESSTGFGIVIAPPGIDRIFFESPGCNEFFGLNQVDFEKISDSRLLHFGYPPLLKQFFINNGADLLALFSKAQEMKIITSLDLSLPDASSASGSCDWPLIMQKVLTVTDIFVPSAEELLYIMEPSVYEEIQEAAADGDMIDFIPLDTIRNLGRKIIGLGVSVLLIKMAHRGVYLLTGDVSSMKRRGELKISEIHWSHAELHCQAYQADMNRFKNASGAGDTAVAAFLSALLDGTHPALAIRYASLAGRNNLYSDDIYADLDDWRRMTDEIAGDATDPVIDLKSTSLIL